MVDKESNNLAVLFEDNIGNIKPERRKGKRGRKMNEKEILYEYREEIDNEKSVKNQKKIYENFQYLSFNEKKNIEDKYTSPKNRSQEEYVRKLKIKQKKIIVATGPAGTGKTLFATEFGIKNLFMNNIEKIIFTRPSVSVDEDLGYLPGTLEEKMAPWVRPIYDILYRFIHPKEVMQLLEDKTIEIAPLGYMRGRTFKNAWIIADEMQNSTVPQMKMLLTRLGENSRLIITGDLEQHDRKEERNGLEDFLEKFQGKRSSSITSIEFQRDDIEREEVVKEVLDIYSSEKDPSYLYYDELVDEV